MAYLIGDTIRLKATIKDFSDTEHVPTSIKIDIYDRDGDALVSSGDPILTTDTTAQYYYDYTISTGITAEEQLTALWRWSDLHKKRISFNVIPPI
jgi:hypothetical protein